MKTVKKPPMRHCLGCGAELPKNELIRVVRSPEGVISIDTTGKSAGRGAYICKKASCLQKARKSGRLGKALDSSISDEIYEVLKDQTEGKNG
ncbi:MAG: YlxR family protein [Clostridia bacterium]|nr:YlxR family protein [Clostridia bacterium]